MLNIDEWSIQNKSIRVEHINLVFASKGMYRLVGENGCGKTTLIEKIIFGEGVGFDCPEEEELYRKNRHNLFSYCPQKIVQNRLRVEEYIIKGNSSVDRSEMERLLVQLGFEKSILRQRFDNLSGGEQMKAAIVSALLKETPYIFFDEPSNYMDDASTMTLRQILIEESKKRCVILISHDERLVTKDTVDYLFENHTIHPARKVEYSCNTSASDVEKAEKDHSGDASACEYKGCSVPGTFRILRYFTKNVAFFISLLVASVLAILMIFQTEQEIRDKIGEDEYPPRGSAIIQKNVMSDEWGDIYREAVGIKVEPGCEERYLLYSDIPSLAEIQGVSKIFLYANGSYLLHVWDYFNAQDGDENRYNPAEGICPVAFPQEVQQSDAGGIPCFLRLEAGRPPVDDAGEIAASKELLSQCFGYDTSRIEDALGKHISIILPGEESEREYTVVGINAQPFELISYENGMQYGGCWYSKEGFEAFLSSEQKGYLQHGFAEFEVPKTEDEFIVFFDENYEPDILNYLFAHYPYNIIVSRHCFIEQNRAVIREMGINSLWRNLVASVLLFGIVFFFCRNSVRYNSGMLWDVGNYYLNRKKLYRQYVTVNIGVCAILFLLIEIWNVSGTHFIFWTSIYVLLYFFTFSAAIILSSVFGKRRTIKEYGIEI